MGLMTYEGIAVVERNGRGLRIETYQDTLAMVMSLMNHGSLGGGGIYGDEQHKAALNVIEKHLANVRESIAEQEKADAEHDANVSNGRTQPRAEGEHHGR